LQSLASEDALTWNVFGPIVYGSAEVRSAYVAELLAALKIGPAASPSGPWVWLSRRVPHPGNLSPGGPEIDVGIHVGDVLMLIEAKWLSGVGQAQGLEKNQDQLELRDLFCRGVARRLFPSIGRFVVLGLSRQPGSFEGWTSGQGSDGVVFEELTWEQVCAFRSHPTRDRLLAYLEWKERHGGRT
jgi:hypothetical protein